MMKKLFVLFTAILLLLSGCATTKPDDLSGFLMKYNRLYDEDLSVTDFLTYEQSGELSYVRITGSENGEILLNLRCEPESGWITSCSVTSLKKTREWAQTALAVCRTFSGLSEEELPLSVLSDGESRQLGDFVFTLHKNESAVSVRVDSVRFCGQPKNNKPSYPQSDQTSGQ